MKVTIKEIAKEAGVSISAVSLVLNKRPCRISQTKKDLIFATADKYHYRVNQAARSLVTRKTYTLGMIIPDIENPFFSSLCKHMEEYCRSFGYVLIIVNTNDQESEDLILLDMLVARGIDGLFIIPSNEALLHDNELKKALLNLTIPFIQIDRYFEQFDADSIYYDDEAGAEMAIEYLIQQGHSRIACIGSLPSTSKNGSARIRGYKKVMKIHNLPIYDQDIYCGNYRFEDGYTAAASIIQTGVQAIFICNDMMTLGFLHYLYEQHLYENNTYTIVSYDNMLNTYLIGKHIACIEQNVSLLSKDAVRRMMHRLKEPDITTEHLILQPKLITK